MFIFSYFGGLQIPFGESILFSCNNICKLKGYSQNNVVCKKTFGVKKGTQRVIHKIMSAKRHLAGSREPHCGNIKSLSRGFSLIMIHLCSVGQVHQKLGIPSKNLDSNKFKLLTDRRHENYTQAHSQ